jgi:integrase
MPTNPTGETPPSRKLERTKTQGVFKRGGTYVVRYRDATGRQKQRSARTYDQARKLRSALNADVARGEHRELSRVRFAEYVDTWGQTYAGRTGTGIRPDTLARYRADLDKHAVPHFGRRRLVEIEPRDIKGFAASLADTGLAPASVRNIIAPLRALLATAVEEGLIRHNPAANLRLPSRVAPSLPGDDDDGPVKALTPDELAALIAAAPEGPRRLMIQLTAATGLRISEVLALRWKRIDFDAGRVQVRRAITQSGREDVPKSRYSRRDVPVSPGMLALLRRHKLASAYSGNDDFVFPTLTGTAQRYENTLRRILKPAALAAGLTVPVLEDGRPILDREGQPLVRAWPGWHTLRHTCASQLFRQGANAKQVQVWLGHHSPAFTLERYVHLLPDDLPEARVLDELVGL